MSELPRRIREIFERQPNKLRQRFESFSDEQGYTIAEMENGRGGFAFQVLDENLKPASKEVHEIFRNQFCLLDDYVTLDTLHVEDSAEDGIYLWAEAKY